MPAPGALQTRNSWGGRGVGVGVGVGVSRILRDINGRKTFGLEIGFGAAFVTRKVGVGVGVRVGVGVDVLVEKSALAREAANGCTGLRSRQATSPRQKIPIMVSIMCFII